mmetsp:Transcript_8639/g.10917  ORF Transcript_8639/g.10917 Transcript_8639/m.10917 type:complete len:92 (+) Transcript_8639:484-759(+)
MEGENVAFNLDVPKQPGARLIIVLPMEVENVVRSHTAPRVQLGHNMYFVRHMEVEKGVVLMVARKEQGMEQIIADIMERCYGGTKRKQKSL